MKCPYCLSEVDENASVCKVCIKDLYLLSPLVKKIELLEEQLKGIPERQILVDRISELESIISEREEQAERHDGRPKLFLDVFIFLIVPLILLIGSHALITIIYDAKLIYLRVVSLFLPFAFAFALFYSSKRRITPWVIVGLVLSGASVFGMSWITSLVDQTPVVPQSFIEWREFVEYSASISLSFISGILVGSIIYIKNHPRKVSSNQFIKLVVASLPDEKISPQTVNRMMESFNSYGSTVIAVGTTALSIYTGLKAVIS